jgi:hypothetical protein
MATKKKEQPTALAEPELEVVTREQLTTRCAEVCPDPMESTLPTPWPPEPMMDRPGVASLAPNTAVHGTGPDLTMTVTGTDFKPYSVIVFNGGDEVTTYISPTQLSTGVKPSLVGAAIAVPVQVRNGSQISNSKPFTFT